MGGHLFSLDECMLEGVKSVRICRSAPHQPTASTSLSLETVASYVLELEVEVGDRHYSSITLREVPTFLLEAFRDLRRRGLEVEGLFRKEGNWSRLKNIFPVYFGCVGIPKECTVHDICSMIKRFFRELKTPLFAHLEAELIDIASGCEGEVRRNRLLDSVTKLPPSHIGTLAYLLRQLKYFGDHHEGHHMTVENLSRVFAPTLFREGDIQYGHKKKKRNPQKPLYTVMLDNTELKITIINELIESAAKVAVPPDPYIFSRRPSELNFNKAQAKKACLQLSASMRSSSAKPFTRNSSSRPTVFASGDAKDKKIEKAKHKGREGRRSSSTVREIFSSISSISTKVLRRAASPSRMLSRRTSADIIAVENAPSIDLKLRCTESAVQSSQSRKVDVESDVIDFVNEEEEEQLKTVTFDNEEDKVEDQISNRRLKAKTPILDDSAMTGSQRRSRRESPRKHLTVNSRIKPVGDPMIGVNWWPASPAFEPPQMSIKRLSEVVQRKKEPDESSEKTRDNKIVKRNSSSKSNKTALDKNHIALSFLEDYEGNKAGNDRRRRHTAPLKLNSILKRNQPNTIATGLKNVQIRVRDRRALTLSFRSTPGEPARRFDKMKRRSESLGGESSDRSQISDDENISINMTPVVDATTLLEQRNNESRQRRAKRKKRKDKDTECADVNQLTHMSKPFESPSVSLLDDVTNALERLERERRPNLENNFQCDQVDSQPSTSINSLNSPTCKQSTPIENSKDVCLSPDASDPTNLLESTNFSSLPETTESPTRPYKSEAVLKASEGNSELMKSRLSDKICGKIPVVRIPLCKKTSPQDPQLNSQFCGNARPSVAFIKHNNRGMVKQRVNQFAQLESQNLMESFSSRSSQNSICVAGVPSYELMKPSAPPVTHGLRPAERRLTMSPPSTCSSLSRTKLSDVSSSNSSPRFSPQKICQKSSSPVLRVTSSTPSKANQVPKISPKESPVFTPLVRRKMKQ